MDEKPKRRSLVNWLAFAAVCAVFLWIGYDAWVRAYGVPEWYRAYLVWQSRRGLYWLPF